LRLARIAQGYPIGLEISKWVISNSKASGIAPMPEA
jgi:hypothetical protein